MVDIVTPVGATNYLGTPLIHLAPRLYTDGTTIGVLGANTPPPPAGPEPVITPMHDGSTNEAQINGLNFQPAGTYDSISTHNCAYIHFNGYVIADNDMMELTYVGENPVSGSTPGQLLQLMRFGIIDVTNTTWLINNPDPGQYSNQMTTWNGGPSGNRLGVVGYIGGNGLLDMGFNSSVTNYTQDAGFPPYNTGIDGSQTAFRALDFTGQWTAGGRVAIGVSGSNIYLYTTLSDGTPANACFYDFTATPQLPLSLISSGNARFIINFFTANPIWTVSAPSMGASFYNTFPSTPVTSWNLRN